MGPRGPRGPKVSVVIIYMNKIFGNVSLKILGFYITSERPCSCP